MIEVSDIITNSKLPPFIRDSRVFKNKDNIGKIFPHIGLDNFKLPISKAKYQAPFIFSSGYTAAKLMVSGDNTVPKLLQYLGIMLFSPIIWTVLTNDTMKLVAWKKQNKNLKIVFTADGKEGAWDLATMSMRGASSCMSWSQRKAYHLIGSIIDPYCGIIYLTDEEDNGYGPNMKCRAIVRYVIHPKLGPALFLERLYSQNSKITDDESAMINLLFASVLKQKSKLPIIYKDMIDGEVRERVVSHFSIPESFIVKSNMDVASYRDSGIAYRRMGPSDLNKYLIAYKHIRRVLDWSIPNVT